nr:repressor of filamentous growth 1 [Quercus suber]
MPNRPHGELTLKQTWLPRHSLGDVAARRGSTAPPPSDPWFPASSLGSRALSLPEEQPSYERNRKRSSDAEDYEPNGADTTSTTSANTADDRGVHVCICPPDPKIPRPRNAFILYRQHYQASVVAKHPSLANPEISKIIGVQWQSQSQETKNKWKALAEEEKHRHQLQYPGYRYQPKRNDRRNSLVNDPHYAVEHSKCLKCGGRTILAPSTPHTSQTHTAVSVPLTPQSDITPGSRTVPRLRELSLRSPSGHQISHGATNLNMSPSQFHADDQRENWPGTPDWKRRRMSTMSIVTDQPDMGAHPTQSRYVTQGTPVSQGTPLSFRQEQGFHIHHPSKRPHPLALDQGRRESLPSVRSVVNSPAMMAPPPKPVVGYQQHRLAQGHVTHDRSLTLPPLQTGRSPNDTTSAVGTAGSTQLLEEQIMMMPFRHKIMVLGRIARPACADDKDARGPLIAIEGDNAHAVKELGDWLSSELRKGSDMDVQLIDGPKAEATNDGRKPMAQYHLLIAEWLSQSDNIVRSLSRRTTSSSYDSRMHDISSAGERAQSGRGADGDNDHDDSSSNIPKPGPNLACGDHEDARSSSTPDRSTADKSQPVGIIPNFSLHASNVFACRIPVEANEAYTSSDHWSWTATQWRGIVGPDLTIYVRDSNGLETGRPNVEMLEEGNLFLVKRVDAGKGLEIEASASRRLAFEVSEWIRAFGSSSPVSS